MQTFTRGKRRRASVRDAVQHAVGRLVPHPGTGRLGHSNWPSWYGDESPRDGKTGVLRADDPIFKLIGIAKGDVPPDWSENKHKYLAEALMDEIDVEPEAEDAP